MTTKSRKQKIMEYSLKKKRSSTGEFPRVTVKKEGPRTIIMGQVQNQFEASEKVTLRQEKK
jgi:uncharacterized protein (DUF58 family)